MSVGSILFGVLGLLCLLYCLGIGLFVNYGTSFFMVWGALAVFFGAVSLVLSHKGWLETIPVWVKVICIICFTAAVLFFCWIEILIVSEFSRLPAPGADYVIVLGAQWKENGPSYVLQKRLDQALEYLRENPGTKVIVSGGQGSNEPISEAEGMYGYLVAAGVEPERILKEDRSVNTYQNLLFSGELLDKAQNRVVIVTNNFHIFRAVKIAQKQGYAKAEGMSAASYPWMLPNNMLREFFGVVKDFAVGNL